jgi:hypothetical protein
MVNDLLAEGKLTKAEIYDAIVENLQVPRATVRRVVSQMRGENTNEVFKKICG